MSDDPLTLANQLCFAVYSTAHAFNRVYKPLLGKLGLTYPQYLTLLVLWEQDDQTVKAIGERLCLDSGTLTPLLKRLESGGLVRRTRDPADERSVRIALTDRGRALRTQAEDIPLQVGCAVGRPLPEIQKLKEDLLALRARLDAVTSQDHQP